MLSLEPKFSAKLIEEFDGDIIQETNNKLLKCGRTKGIQYYESSEPGNGWFAWNYSDFSESIVEVTARIPSDYKNAWILNLADGQNSHGTAIAIFGDGKAWIGQMYLTRSLLLISYKSLLPMQQSSLQVSGILCVCYRREGVWWFTAIPKKYLILLISALR